MSHGYHGGEIRVQQRAGVRAMARRIEHSIRPEIPERAQRFLEEQRMLVLGTSDPAGRPWASVLTGERGFAAATDARVIRIVAAPALGDPLIGNLHPGALVGMVATDFERRMRLRVNGRLDRDGEGAIVIRADQVYSNCPKYIQARRLDHEDGGPAAVSPPVRTATLSEPQRAWMRNADTFFIATANPGEGADASHRGGMPGFVDVEANRIAWPDYAGNSMFGTLGNIEMHPRAGLVFPDFESGSTLQVTGHAAVEWDPGRAASAVGAQRWVTLDVEAVVEIRGAFPLRLRFLAYSPFNPRQ